MKRFVAIALCMLLSVAAFSQDYSEYYKDLPITLTAPAKTESFVPEFTDIHISNVVCRDARIGIKASGTIRMIHNITLENCIFFYTEEASLVDDPGMLLMKSVSFFTYR